MVVKVVMVRFGKRGSRGEKMGLESFEGSRKILGKGRWGVLW